MINLVNTCSFHPASIAMPSMSIVWLTMTSLVFTRHVGKPASSLFSIHSGKPFPSLTSINLSLQTSFINFFRALYDTLLHGFQVQPYLGLTRLMHDVTSYPGITVLPSFPGVLQHCLVLQDRNTRTCAASFLGLSLVFLFPVARYLHASSRLSALFLTLCTWHSFPAIQLLRSTPLKRVFHHSTLIRLSSLTWEHEKASTSQSCIACFIMRLPLYSLALPTIIIPSKWSDFTSTSPRMRIGQQTTKMHS